MLTRASDLVQTVPQPSAILDIRFHPSRTNTLAVVSSTATLAIFELDPSCESPLRHLETSQCDGPGELEPGTLFLQCNWLPTHDKALGVTTSTGLSRVLILDDDWAIQDSVDLSVSNTLEAWCIAFAPLGQAATCLAYCGGDDSMLRYSTVTSSLCSRDSTILDTHDEPSVSDSERVEIRGRHNAGVTAILPLGAEKPHWPRLVFTGSYDDHLRLFTTDPSRGNVLRLVMEKDLGGGVWRLDHVETEQIRDEVTVRILASCMHAGARIVEFRSADGIDWTCAVLARFEEHQSMNYGSDFVRDGDGGPLTCVSTSFYDRLLCVWALEEL